MYWYITIYEIQDNSTTHTLFSVTHFNSVISENQKMKKTGVNLKWKTFQALVDLHK